MNYEHRRSSIKINELLSIINTDQSNLTDVAYKKIRDLVNENINLKQLLENNVTKTKELIKHNHRIISIIAHDLRSPYNNVLSILEFLLKNSNIEKDTMNQYLKVLKTSTEDSLEMLDSMIQWSIINNYSRIVKPQLINLHALVQKVMDSNRSLSQVKNITLINDIPDYFEIIADQNIIETIIRNLIDNAIHYNEENGKVVVTIDSKTDQVDIFVTDSGKGIDVDALDKLFSNSLRDSQIHTNPKLKGLGLLLVKELVQLHESEIFFYKNNEKGTTVQLRIFNKIAN